MKVISYYEYRHLVFSDLYRIYGKVDIFSLLHEVLFGESYKYIFWMRTCRYTITNKFLKYTIYPFSRCMLNRLIYKLGIVIPLFTEIGSGFYIGHFGGIVVSHEAIIGKNCNLSQGVTIGQANRGKNKGCPKIGDNVYIGPGSKIIGAVKIGNNVAIGANCVVTKDIPDNSVVVGIPGKVISFQGSDNYINRIDYDDKIM